jgi:cell division protease FtsH
MAPGPERPAGTDGAVAQLIARLAIVLCFFLAVGVLSAHDDRPPRASFADFLVALEQGDIKHAVLETRHNSLQAEGTDGRAYTVGYPPPYGAELVEQMQSADVDFDVKGGGTAWLERALPTVILVVLLGGFWLMLRRRSLGRGAGPLEAFRRAPAREVAMDAPRTRFADVAGADEAVQELREITTFLRSPSRFEDIGARIPKGVLLFGPPGTGKTLLARAVAGEAGVPFLSISGSDFVEMFVGVGAGRVRDLFGQARQRAPAIVFVDEIDAVGRHRGAGIGGGNDEREQTLNQLLVEMDGFEATDRVIVIAATNRPDILDPALLRPGRFDRQIAVEAPLRAGRRKILELHTQGKPLARDVDLDALAARTAGLTGADLANIVNEAALLAARRGRPRIGQPELENGILRLVAGPQRRSRVVSAAERHITAVHELGHALVGHHLPHADPIHTISILPRGQSLGRTITLPTEDKALTSRAELEDRMTVALAGRAAEEVVFNQVTTSGARDLESVTATAKDMVMRFGMSRELGPRVFGHNALQPFVGRSLSRPSDYSQQTARDIDAEIRNLVGRAYEVATQMLDARRAQLEDLARVLLERETLGRTEFEALLARTPVTDDGRVLRFRPRGPRQTDAARAS